MFGCECFCWSDYSVLDYPQEPQPFSLPVPLPNWPKGQGFGTGKIQLGELEVIKITTFERISCFNRLCGKSRGLSFYRPIEIPEDFHCLGYYCQSNEKPLRGYILAVRCCIASLDSLKQPLNYTNIWSIDSDEDGCLYFWFPNPPEGYRAMGVVVTDGPNAPDLGEVCCVREDLTELCEPSDLIGKLGPKNSKIPLRVWETQPLKRGREEVGVSVGTFFCDTVAEGTESDITISCLKNLDCSLQGMPNLDQIDALIGHYGPTIFFHPDEPYLSSSVEWFFKNGALLFQNGKEKPERINFDGSNLPSGGCNDGEFWMDLPEDEDSRTFLLGGNLESAEMYVHVKPAIGGTFTDIAMWVFCPFNGPSTLKVGLMSVAMTRLGQHVGDWEHFTLRISNFTGELWGIYFSEHSGGGWVNSFGLEFFEQNRPIVYSSKHGHVSFPHSGTFLQGSSKLGIGVRNDTAKSDFVLDSSKRYRVVAAEYLGEGAVEEPKWLNYMREWGPTVVYDSRSELDKVINMLPFYVRFSVENLIDLFPTEIYGEEGPTGPKEKDNWDGDERC